jgi:hypothetical protein
MHTTNRPTIRASPHETPGRRDLRMRNRRSRRRGNGRDLDVLRRAPAPRPRRTHLVAQRRLQRPLHKPRERPITARPMNPSNQLRRQPNIHTLTGHTHNVHTRPDGWCVYKNQCLPDTRTHREIYLEPWPGLTLPLPPGCKCGPAVGGRRETGIAACLTQPVHGQPPTCTAHDARDSAPHLAFVPITRADTGD